MTVREKLVEELYKPEYWMESSEGFKKLSIHAVADFILEDRRKLVEPLVKYHLSLTSTQYERSNAIDQTLKNAGITE